MSYVLLSSTRASETKMAVKSVGGQKIPIFTKRGTAMYDENVVTTNEEFQDETLTCRECGNEFVFSAGEQAFYKQKGFLNKPKMCKACRDAKKNAGKAPREYFETTCAECGGVAKVTFQPSSDRPVYCSACFEKRKNAQ